MSNEATKVKPAGSTYGVIHRLGLKYDPPAIARPIFAAEATLAKEFWNEMFIVFDKFRRFAIDESSAHREIHSLVEKYGPRIWGADRANVVSYPCHYVPEYRKDLYWDDGEEVQQFIHDQAMALFENRLSKRDLNARRPGNSLGNTPKRKYQSYAKPRFYNFAEVYSNDDSSDHSELTAPIECSDDEKVSYTLKVPRTVSTGENTRGRKRKRRSPYSLVVRLGYDGCNRENRDELPCNMISPYCCIRSYECLNEQVECKHPAKIASEEIPVLASVQVSMPLSSTMPQSFAARPSGQEAVDSSSVLVPGTNEGQASVSSNLLSMPSLPSNQENSEQVRQTSLERDCTTVHSESESTGQYRKKDPVSWFVAINHSKQPPVSPPHQKLVMPPEKPLQVSSRFPVLSTSSHPIESIVGKLPEIAVSTLPPLTESTLQNPHGQGSVKSLATPVVDISDDGPKPDERPQRRIDKPINSDQTNSDKRNPLSDVPEKDNWALDCLSNTLIHVRAGESWDNIITMDLNWRPDLHDFFARISYELGNHVTHLSVLLPGNIAQLDGYVIQIKQGDDGAYRKMLDILLRGIERLGVHRPVRYVLAVTASCQ